MQHLTGGLGGWTQYGLRRGNEFVRFWTIQLACEDKSISAEILKKFLELARVDSSQTTRLYLASALQRLKPDQRWDALTELVRHAEDSSDHNLPLMYWYAAEACVASDPDRALEMLKACKIPKVREFIARRLATMSFTSVK